VRRATGPAHRPGHAPRAYRSEARYARSFHSFSLCENEAGSMAQSLATAQNGYRERSWKWSSLSKTQSWRVLVDLSSHNRTASSGSMSAPAGPRWEPVGASFRGSPIKHASRAFSMATKRPPSSAQAWDGRTGRGGHHDGRDSPSSSRVQFGLEAGLFVGGALRGVGPAYDDPPLLPFPPWRHFVRCRSGARNRKKPDWGSTRMTPGESRPKNERCPKSSPPRQRHEGSNLRG
jgi:hypothetical protein